VPLFLKRQCDRTLGADPNALTDKGLCPLFTAAVIGFTEAIPLLLEHGALVDTPSQGQAPGVYYTAFHVACSEGFLDCVEALVRAGCDTSIEALGGGTGEQLARTTGQTAVLERLELLRAEQLGDLPAAVAKKKRKKRKKKKVPAQQERDGLVRWGSAAFSLCTTAHALYTRIEQVRRLSF
jgi:ankyrin repeat protein